MDRQQPKCPECGSHDLWLRTTLDVDFAPVAAGNVFAPTGATVDWDSMSPAGCRKCGHEGTSDVFVVKAAAVEPDNLEIPLPWGGKLVCGPGDAHQWGSTLTVFDAAGKEVAHWTVDEWEEDGELVIGAVFGAACHPKPEWAQARPASAVLAQVREIVNARTVSGAVFTSEVIHNLSRFFAEYDAESAPAELAKPAWKVWLPAPGDDGRYRYPDGTVIARAFASAGWLAYWSPKPGVGGKSRYGSQLGFPLTDGESSSPYRFQSPEAAAQALGEGGEGPAKHTPDGRPRG